MYAAEDRGDDGPHAKQADEDDPTGGRQLEDPLHHHSDQDNLSSGWRPCESDALQVCYDTNLYFHIQRLVHLAPGAALRVLWKTAAAVATAWTRESLAGRGG